MADLPAENSTTKVQEVNGLEDEIACESFMDGQLSYVGHGIKSIPQKLIDDYSKVTTRLDLSLNQIKSLDGLEEFCHLQELVLDNNDVNDSAVFPKLPQLHTLTLNKNKIIDLDHLINEIKMKLPNLAYLSLLGNPACRNQLSSQENDDDDYLRYRYQVLYSIPELKFLDSSPVTETDLQEARRVGPFLQVVRGADTNSTIPEESPPSPSQYSPLPASGRSGEQHQGSFGKSRYVYYGRHSEGNRFIRNTDL